MNEKEREENKESWEIYKKLGELFNEKAVDSRNWSRLERLYSFAVLREHERQELEANIMRSVVGGVQEKNAAQAIAESQQQEIDRLRNALIDLMGFARPHLRRTPGEQRLQVRLLKTAIENAETVLEPQEEKVCPECGSKDIEWTELYKHFWCRKCGLEDCLSPTQEGESDE